MPAESAGENLQKILKVFLLGSIMKCGYIHVEDIVMLVMLFPPPEDDRQNLTAPHDGRLQKLS